MKKLFNFISDYPRVSTVLAIALGTTLFFIIGFLTNFVFSFVVTLLIMVIVGLVCLIWEETEFPQWLRDTALEFRELKRDLMTPTKEDD